MPITTDWYDDDKTIIIHTFTGRWSMRELYTHLEYAADMLDSNSPPRYFISDLRQSEGFPMGLLSEGKRLDDIAGAENTLTIVVGANQLIKVIGNTLQKMGMRLSFVFVDTLAEADAVIANDKTQQQRSQFDLEDD